MNETKNHSLTVNCHTEALDCCPVCNCNTSSLIYSNLEDKIFHVGGKWSFFKCKKCETMFLNPRIKIENINLAYKTYYTHKTVTKNNLKKLSIFRELLNLLANDYRNKRYGTQLSSITFIGRFLILFVPKVKANIDHEFRHIPISDNNNKLLDFGFGSGAFLKTANSAGYSAVGVDYDIVAVENAKLKGLDVYQGDLAFFENKESLFDVITMSHVIEHMHEPKKVIDQAFRLLAPGGMLFMEFPNINSFGHMIYGRNWRGLEPPRHLTLMTWDKITDLLYEQGFYKVNHLPNRFNFYSLSIKSLAIKKNKDPYKREFSLVSFLIGLFVFLLVLFNYKRTEFITLVAYKNDI